MASVIGIGGTAGAIGGMLMTTYNGYILEIFKSYQPIFIVAGSAYLVAIVVTMCSRRGSSRTAGAHLGGLTAGR